MAKIELTQEQAELEKELLDLTEQIRNAISGSNWDEAGKLIKNASLKAHALHGSLTDSGHPPIHHSQMLKNRGIEPTNREFYNHLHPIEDLLAFVDNPSANVPPADQTLNQSFTFQVFNHRWNRKDTYRFTRTETGWNINYGGIGGSCNKKGEPYLYSNFSQDSIEYPRGVGSRLEWLWEQAKEQGLSVEQVQSALKEVADWVSLTERNKPRDTGVWNGGF